MKIPLFFAVVIGGKGRAVSAAFYSLPLVFIFGPNP
jgi:hypothetical protein